MIRSNRMNTCLMVALASSTVLAYGWGLVRSASAEVADDHGVACQYAPAPTTSGFRMAGYYVAKATRPEGPYEFKDVVLGRREKGKGLWDSAMASNPAVYKVFATCRSCIAGSRKVCGAESG